MFPFRVLYSPLLARRETEKQTPLDRGGERHGAYGCDFRTDLVGLILRQGVGDVKKMKNALFTVCGEETMASETPARQLRKCGLRN